MQPEHMPVKSTIEEVMIALVAENAERIANDEHLCSVINAQSLISDVI